MVHVIQFDITGSITYENNSMLLLEDMLQNEHEEEIGGIVVWINSGGGSFCAAQDMITMLKSAEVPVVSVIGEICASAAYYTILESNYIIARPASLVGGLCASLDHFDYSGLHKKIGVQRKAYSNGALKSMLSPFGICDAKKESAATDEILNDLDMQFYEYIKANRNGVLELEKYTDGRLITGRMANSAGLVDGCGGIRDAYTKITEILGISLDDLNIIKPQLESFKDQGQIDVVSTLLDSLHIR